MKQPVVILCGFMGTGKSTVGAELASILDITFIDTDTEIEARAGKTISEIFATDGEAVFRSMEADMCRSLDVSNGAVVATGGGMIVDADNFAHLKALGTMVLLEANMETLSARLDDDTLRPRLRGATNRDGIRDLLEARHASYARIELKVNSARRSPVETAVEIAERIHFGDDIRHVRVATRPLPGPSASPGRDRLSRIIVFPGATARLSHWMNMAELSGPAFIVAPASIGDRYRDRLTGNIESAGIPCRWLPINDGDTNKTIAQSEELIDALANARLGRDGIIVAAGGGVTGDLVGFVAATYMRGVALVHVPTTLVAQVDSSIGGKVGVNHPHAKNLVGTVYHPHLVVTDVELLGSLPPRELAAGLAEVVKTAIIDAPDLFAWLRERALASPASLDLDVGALDRCVRECIRVKADIIERDPYERDLRRVLNLGHTLGHALEAAAGYDTLRHGEAVAIGLVAAVRVAVARGVASVDFLRDTEAVLSACGLKTVAPQVSPDKLRQAMALDKKVRGGRLTFILPLAPGHVEIVDDVGEDEILSAAGGDRSHRKEPS